MSSGYQIMMNCVLLTDCRRRPSIWQIISRIIGLGKCGNFCWCQVKMSLYSVCRKSLQIVQYIKKENRQLSRNMRRRKTLLQSSRDFEELRWATCRSYLLRLYSVKRSDIYLITQRTDSSETEAFGRGCLLRNLMLRLEKKLKNAWDCVESDLFEVEYEW